MKMTHNTETEILISDEEATIIPDVCKRHCSVCEGMDHHWMPGLANEDEDGDTVDGEMVMVCKHCEAVREVGENEDEF
jgi:hypothetical protein